VGVRFSQCTPLCLTLYGLVCGYQTRKREKMELEQNGGKVGTWTTRWQILTNGISMSWWLILISMKRGNYVVVFRVSVALSSSEKREKDERGGNIRV